MTKPGLTSIHDNLIPILSNQVLKPRDTFLAFMMAQRDSQNVNIRCQFLFISLQFILIVPQLLLRVIAMPELTCGGISGI